jgi:predicted ATP-dependent Lon-type protease
VIDLLGNRVEAEVGVAFFVASYFALRKAPVSPALLVLGDMSVQGNIKPIRSLTEPLQVARDNGDGKGPAVLMIASLPLSATIGSESTAKFKHLRPKFPTPRNRELILA